MSERVTMTRAEYDALLSRIEDAEDAAAMALQHERVAVKGAAAVMADALPVEAVERLIAGETPVRVWRQHRGLNQKQLAVEAGLSAAYLNEIETGKKPGSLDAMAKLARALKVTIEDLLPWVEI